MAVIGIIAGEERAREELRLAVEELGHRAAPAMDLRGGLELVGSQRPKLMLVLQAPAESTAESLLAELERAAPLLPVLVALSPRKSSRAIELLKAGAFEVLSPPFTAENLSPPLAKALRYRGTAFEVVRPPEQARGALQYLAAALLVAGLAMGFAQLQKHRRLARLAESSRPVAAYALPYSHPAGLAFDGRELWISDWFSLTIHRHDPKDMRVLRSVSLPREQPGAIALAQDGLWVAGAPHGIVKHMLDDKLTELGRYPDLQNQSVGLAYDGLYLWSADAQGRRIHKRLPDEGLTVAASFEYPGSRPAALTFDGSALWSIDAGNKELLRHDLENPRLVLDRLALPEYRSGEWLPVGLAWSGGHFWSVAQRGSGGDGPGRVFAHFLPKPEPAP